jgi:urease beta subunit
MTPEELPGAVVCLKTPIKINEGRRRWKVKVANEGDRPIQVRIPNSFESVVT